MDVIQRIGNNLRPPFSVGKQNHWLKVVESLG
jgi:hypothetical protein